MTELSALVVAEFAKEARTVDDLLAHPDEAKQFVCRVRMAANDPSLTDPEVLRHLLRLRKRGGIVRRAK